MALLGCGYWGERLARNLAELGVLAAVADPRTDSAGATADMYSVPSIAVEEAFVSDSVDAIAIAAPAVLHHDLAVEGLKNGKHVFVEKPLALTLADAEELVELSEGSGRILMVGHLIQYHPAFLQLKELVDAGRFGRLQYVYSNRLNLGRFRQEEDILWSFAPHDISMILALIEEEPVHVRAVGSYHLGTEIADVTMTHLTFPGGERAHIYVSWLHPYKEQRLVVVGDEGMAVFDDGEPWATKLQTYSHRVLWEQGVPHPVKADAEPVTLHPVEPLRAELEHFLECVLTGSSPRTDGREGVRVLRVLVRAAGSMQESEWQ